MSDRIITETICGGLRLTDAEREAVEFAANRLLASYVDEREVAMTLRGLLERTAPKSDRP